MSSETPKKDSFTLGELIDDLAERDGDRAAVWFMRRKDIDEWSYRQLAEHAQQLAQGLRDNDDAAVEKGESVALIAGSRPEWIASCLGIIRAGGVATPLDVQLGDDTLKRIIADADIRHIFTDASQLERLEQIDFSRQIHYHVIDADKDNERSWLRLLRDGDSTLPTLEPDDQATLFYTSGTTGPPKGVPLKHRNFQSQIVALRESRLATEDDSILLPLPFHHVYPFVMGMLVPLALGATIVLPRSRTGPELVRALRETQATRIIGVPRLYRAMFDGLQSKAQSAGVLASAFFKAATAVSTFARKRLGIKNVGRVILRPLHRQFGPHLELLASGGSPLDPDLAWKLEGLGWRIAVGYGLTETAPLLTLLTPDTTPDGTRFDTVGKPIRDVDISIDPQAVPGRDDDNASDSSQPEQNGATDRPNIEGEVLARGPNVFEGYRNLPDKTEEAFTDDWYRTGDLGFLDDDGYLHLTGRVSTLIVTEGGKNIQPDDVEDAYAKHALVREVGVLQQDKQLVALIVPEVSEIHQPNDGDHAASMKDEVRKAVEAVSRKLPSYQRISDFTITRQSLPRTRLGKLRRHKLESLYDEITNRGDEAQDEKPEPIPIEEMDEEDRNLLRHSAAKQVWNWFVERYPDRRVTPDSSPQLDLGIDSMEWLNLTLEIGQRTGIELSEETINDLESIRDLLEHIVEAAEAGEAEMKQPLDDPDAVLSDEQKQWLEPLGGGMSAAATIARTINRTLMRSYFRLIVRGKEHLPHNRHFLLTPNHLSHIDPFLVGAALDDETLSKTHWGAWTGVALRNPFNRIISRLGQIVPVEPERAAMSSLALGSAVLMRSRNLVWFPEGRRSETGELQEFRQGIGMLLDRYRDVPVVPVAIRGTFEAMPVGNTFPRPQHIEITFGEALDVERLDQDGTGDTPPERITNALHKTLAMMLQQ